MDHRQFWQEVFARHTSATPGIKLRVAIFGAIAAAVWAVGNYTNFIPSTEVAPYELIGAALAVILMIRTNAGYDRWYEGRKLWGGIVNQSRNLAQIGLNYGPHDRGWREPFIRWTAVFSHACRHSLRGEKNVDDVRDLLDERELAQLHAAEHMPLFVTNRIGVLLQEAMDADQFDRFAFMQAEHQRNQLIDHIGACERILKTPLAEALSVKIRRFLFLYLLALPFGLFDKVGVGTPLIVMLVAYPLLSLDQISVELQNPFSRNRVSHLPLNDICGTIQRNLLALLEDADEKPAEIYAPNAYSVWSHNGKSGIADTSFPSAQHSA